MTDKQLLALYRLLAAHRAFFAAWQRCEARGGCYWLNDSHNVCCVCDRDRSSKLCTCGRDEIERIAHEINLNESPL
jgi:hypothetical protein